MGEASTLAARRRAATDSAAIGAAAANKRQALAAAAHLSPAVEVALRLLPGNDRCADCKAIYPQWAGVSFGVLLCLACAGQHRALGVRVSVVKSLAMDSWTPAEQRMLEVGGNAKWTAVCAGTSTSELPIADKYQSSIAAAYRSRVAAVAAEPSSTHASLTATEFLAVLSSIAAPSSRAALPHPAIAKAHSMPLTYAPLASPDSTDQVPTSDDVLCVKCTTCRSSIPLDQLNDHSASCVVNASNAVMWRQYERELGSADAPLGFSLSKTNGGFAEVSRVTPGGAAERANVLVGSFVVGLNDRSTSLFEEIVDLVRTLPRPIRFHFAFRPSAAAKRSIATISSVPEPVSVDVNVTFEDAELGCSFEASDFACVVKSVDDGGAARRLGVLVGSRVVAVNGRRFLKPSEMLQAMQSAQRPIHVKLHRVEGLMLGWRR